MMHFSCDSCGRAIQRERYEVRIEMAEAFDPDEITEEDLDVDHLQAIAESLEELADTSEFEVDPHRPKRHRLDLCPACAASFARDPLGHTSRRRLKFSQN